MPSSSAGSPRSLTTRSAPVSQHRRWLSILNIRGKARLTKVASQPSSIAHHVCKSYCHRVLLNFPI